VLSAVFATALTVVAFCEAYVEPWRVEPGAPAPITLRLPRTTLRAFDREAGESRLIAARSVVRRGEVVSDPTQAGLVRAYEKGRRPPRTTHVAAQWAVYFVLSVVSAAYMRRISAKNGALLRTQVALFALALAFLVVSKVLLLTTGLPALIFPIAMVPLWASLYVDRRTGSMWAVLLSLYSASLVVYDPIISVVYLISTCVGALSFKVATRKRNVFLIASGCLSGFVGALVYIATKEIFDGFDLDREIDEGWRSGPIAALASGAISGLVAFFLQPAASKIVGAVSRSQLLLLTDLEQPLLKKMAAQAPGSWEHSRAMANLAEASAAAIGADALLTRVGAYYHDLGKTCQAKYFIENLTRGERSPHEDLEPDVSADAIMAHVVEGVRILREGRVPEAVVEFSYTHHGTSIIEYFWHKCLAQGNPKGLTEESFRYPGVRPRTRETAILMLIDSIEAGARTVDPPTREKFLEMVQRVIFVKMHQGQLDESGLSIADIRMLAVHITDALVNAYHKRIRYPWQDAHDRGEAPLPVPPGADGRSPLPPSPATPPTAASENTPVETGRYSAMREENGEVSDTGKFRRQAAHDSEPARAHDDSDK
jgi:putative nucleotidyltransferase with HDIG domain